MHIEHISIEGRVTKARVGFAWSSVAADNYLSCPDPSFYGTRTDRTRMKSREPR